MQFSFDCKFSLMRNFVFLQAFMLVLIVTAPAMADNNSIYSQSSEKTTEYYNRYHVEQPDPAYVNPWVAPPRQYGAPTYRNKSENYQYESNNQVNPVPDSGQNLWGGSGQFGRFVSPQKLDQIQQQQKRYQTMPENQHRSSSPYSRYTPRLNSGVQAPYTVDNWSHPGVGNQSIYGTGAVNPLYDTPVVSPWGSGVDVLNKGASFPMVPSEAIGGLPPMHVPSIGITPYSKDGSEAAVGDINVPDDVNIFNPFTFLPNSVE